MSTADAILQVIRAKGIELKQGSDNKYRGASPLRIGSNSDGFVLEITDPEHGAWYDHVGNEGGSLYTLAQRLGVETPRKESERSEPANTKRPYNGLADYAKAHGVDPAVFTAAGWHETRHLERPALVIPTSSGTRWRFLDGNKPTYINETGYVPCFYGLQWALGMVTEAAPLVLCNGEASTVVAQHYGLPAFATTRGENKLPDVLLEQLKAQYGKHLWIAFDCDNAGRKAAKDVAEQYPDSTILDLGLGDKGDLADYCQLYDKDSGKQLAILAAKAQTTVGIPSSTLMRQYIKTLGEIDTSYGRPFRFPFVSFHSLGGLASTLLPGKMVGIIAPSGSGKTAFVETFTDILMQRGLDGLSYSPEWSAQETAQRRVARNGGSDLETMGRFTLWQYEEAYHVPVEKREGRNLTEAEFNRNASIASAIARWPGQVHWYSAERLLEDTLETMARDLHIMRLKGRAPVYAIFDYVQLLESADRDDAVNRFEMAAKRIKEFTQDTAIVSIMVSQIKKDASYSHRNNGKAVTGDDALYLRDDKFNLFFSLNRNYEEDPRTGDMIPQNTGYAQVTKNSAGTTGRVIIHPTLHRYAWVDPKMKGTGQHD